MSFQSSPFCALFLFMANPTPSMMLLKPFGPDGNEATPQLTCWEADLRSGTSVLASIVIAARFVSNSLAFDPPVAASPRSLT